ncbi:unnamed protein product [Caenorhabditis angaria]|uniref:Serpentine Receptor, class I n=1 Tax=Caenorhabditis angaria TaxID=860376 RepID=A0A9P1I5E9_9PELO|nr:unnamed protein product [Caenorhabditis angaria]
MPLECLKYAPDYYRLTLHIIGALSVPINATGIYLVMRHSPKNSSYKYCQLYVQLVTVFVELHMSWTCPGYYYFPLMGGINTNEFMADYIPTHTSVVLYFFLFAFELPSILSCFIYRNEAAAEMNTAMRMPKYLTYFIAVSSHTFPFVVLVLLLKSQLTYEQKKEILQLYYPSCMHVLDLKGFEAYDYRYNYYTAAVGLSAMIYIFFYGFYGLFLAMHTMSILQKMKKHMSAATYKMHRTAIIALTLQCICPFAFICIPINIIFTVIVFEQYELTALATNTMFMIAAHSMVSTMTMIYCNSNYREILKNNFIRIIGCGRCGLNSTTLIEPSISVVRSNAGARNISRSY